MRLHKERVDEISKSVASSTGRIAISRKGGCSARSYTYKQGATLVPMEGMNQVLEIDVGGQFVWVEPMITMESLARATLPQGLIPPVMTEFKHMTIGGAIQGLAGESSSFRAGLFDECVLAYEMVLGNGEIRQITEASDSELFHSITGSYGSFGILTAIQLKLVPASKYVKISYEKVQSIERVVEIFRSAEAESNLEFIEAVGQNLNEFTIIRGYASDNISLFDRIFHFLNLQPTWSRWFYYHMRDRKSNSYDYLTFEDYLFRWDRGAFWASIVQFKHNLKNRFLYGKYLDCKTAYDRLHKKPLLEQNRTKFLQDMMVPLNRTEEYLGFLDRSFGLYPVWLIPIRAPRSKRLFSLPHDKDPIYVDVGIWSDYPKPISTNEMVTLNRKIEDKIASIAGRKCLWSQNYYSSQEFWKIYDQSFYSSLRTRVHAEGRFVDVLEKVTELYRSLLESKEIVSVSDSDRASPKDAPVRAA